MSVAGPPKNSGAVDETRTDSTSDSDVDEDYTVYEDDGRGVLRQVDLRTKPNTQSAQTTRKVQPASMSGSVLKRIHLKEFNECDFGGTGASSSNQRVLNELREANAALGRRSTKEVDASERATVENVMDPRTRLILYKLVNGGFLREVNGCVSTGKEANVYYAVSGDANAEPVAIKIFKTSILIFKDREQYVTGEFRFQRYCKNNPRKMVRTWAEKESRNLLRLSNCGIKAPKVRLLRQHVLLMDFIGTDGWPAPRLKDANPPSFEPLYFEVAKIMRRMYHECKLVHGDLSEYNLLYHDGSIFVIDVAQSVEHDHPRSLDFLRRDIVNINSFFRSKNIKALFQPQDFFHFVTDKNIPDADKAIERHQEECANRPAVTDADTALVDANVFLQITVPRRLDEVPESRQDHHGETQSFVDQMLAPKTHPRNDSHTRDRETREESCDDSSSVEDSETSSSCDQDVRPARVIEPGQKSIAEMSKEERKAHRKAVKAAQALRRTEKTPKHKKKRACKRHQK